MERNLSKLHEVRDSHVNDYREFFAKYDLVTSANYCVSWSPSGFDGGTERVLLRTKTPLECLVGIRASKNGKSSFAKVVNYDVRKDAFETVEFEKLTDQSARVLEIVDEFLESADLPAIEIGVLSETARGHGFGFSWTMSAALAWALFKLAWEATAEELSPADFSRPPLFADEFALAFKIMSVMRYDGTAGSNAAAALLPWQVFIAQVSNAVSEDADPSENFTTGSENAPYLDYGIVFSGLRTDTKAVENQKKTDEGKLERFSTYLRDTLGVKKSETWLGKLSEPGQVHQAFTDSVSATSVKMAYYLRKMVAEGYEEHLAEEIIDAANNYRQAVAMLSKPERFPDRLRTAFLSNVWHPDADFGIFPIYGGKMGGGYLFVMKPQTGREALLKAVDEIRSQYPNAKIEYANYAQGESKNAVIVRQDLENGLVAKELEEGGGFIYSDNLGQFKIGELSDLLDAACDGIVFCEAAGEIHILGNPANSTQLKSQNATIELFGALLSKGTVKNTELPASSYSKNRSEMQSKILWPVGKVFEEAFGKKIPLTCSGTVSEFVMELGRTGVKIGFIKKIGA